MAVQPKKEPGKIYKTALIGILLAQALALSFAESLIPAFSFLPPGAKPGFSNIITMFTASALGLPEALAIAVLKSCFVLATRGMTAFFMSLAGGIVSVIIMSLMLHFRYGIIITAISGAVSHNAAQLVVSRAISGTNAVYSYALPLLIFAVAAGSVTGLILKAILPFLQRQVKIFSRTGNKK